MAGICNLSLNLCTTSLMLLLSIAANASMSGDQDTIRIKEVIITRKELPSDLIGFRKITIDSTTLSNFSHETLAGLLAQNSTVFIKSYGAGGSATPSFRGTGASHTQLQWNSITINNPMPGQSDLSIIPSGFIDEIDIHYGASSMPSCIGGIGGMINLETKPLWKDLTTVTLNPGAASFGQYSGLVKVRTGNQRLQSVTKAYIQYAENNFSYLNTVSSSEPVRETRKNNQTFQKSLMQELYYRKNRNILSARLWYHSSDRNLPSSLLVSQPDNNEKQHDESLRTIISYDAYAGLTEYFFAGAFSASKLKYTNRQASIDSRNMSEMLIFKAGMVNVFGKYVRTKVSVDNENTVVKSENYEDNSALRNIATITTSAEFNGSGRIGGTVLLREIINNNSLLIPDFSTGIQFRVTENRDHFLKTNYSRNSRLPSMNDLFWAPGGNTSLLTESANMLEFIYEMNKKLSSDLAVKFDLSFYFNSIEDFIQWHPGIYSYWVAGNVKSVSTKGLESSLLFKYDFNKIASSLNLNYAYTRATTTGSDVLNDASVGKQLIYVPENQANATLRFSYSRVYSSIISAFTGRRYTTADNTSSLSPYFINSIISGYTKQQRDNIYDISLIVDNVFNLNYETIAYYPQPGRSISLKLLIQFSKQSQ